MFCPSWAGRDLDMQREGRKGQAKKSFLSDVVSFSYLESLVSARSADYTLGIKDSEGKRVANLQFNMYASHLFSTVFLFSKQSHSEHITFWL